jgi:hypothetical protein
VPPLAEDRPPGPDAVRVEATLFADTVYQDLRALALQAEDAESLRRLI